MPWHSGNTFSRYWKRLAEMEELLPFQTMVVREADDEVVATGQCIPFFWPELAQSRTSSEDTFSWMQSLPDGGWDTILARGICQTMARRGQQPTAETSPLTEDQKKDEQIAWSPEMPNALSGLLVNVSEKCRGAAIADALLVNFKSLARQHKLDAVVVPIRPTMKHKFPQTSFEDYYTWTQGKPHQSGFTWSFDGAPPRTQSLPFDPWLRKHVLMGARVVKLATKSFTIEATAEKWQEWLGDKVALNVSVDKNGEKHLDGELLDGFVVDDDFSVPLQWDPVRSLGCYTETDMWVLHPLEDS